MRRRLTPVLVSQPSCCFLFFFFSSRRRHTRYIGDWSSDVCSSDLGPHQRLLGCSGRRTLHDRPWRGQDHQYRSEERRVGKECRSRWWAYHEKKKEEETTNGKDTKAKNAKGTKQKAMIN